AMQQEKARQRTEKKRDHVAKMTGAHTTDPIKDYQMVRKWLKIAEEHDRERRRGGISWYMLLLLGFNTSLRIGDICALRVGDVRDQERVRVVAEKTGKLSNIKLQADVQKRIAALLRGRGEEEYVLQSRQKSGKTGENKPISRQRAFAIIKEIARRADFNEHAGCHTMRKTFAYDLYQTTGDLSLVQKVLNHSSQMETLRYIGLDQMAVDKAIDGMHRMI
ncbi:MAG: tyrosine-type recombinase/integrase, partial [Clostridia bacterium]|nr:tyrosine-type recombinase/integrase [Clostridia bacterium]